MNGRENEDQQRESQASGDQQNEDQDAEPTLNAPGEAGPTGITAPADDEPGEQPGED